MKKVLALVIVLVMCLTLCACGSADNAASVDTKAAAQQTVQDSSKSTVQSISLGDTIELDFAKIVFNSAEVGYSVGGSSFSSVSQDGMRYFSLIGTVENTSGTTISVANINSEIQFNGEYTYKASATIKDSKSYPVSVAPLAKAEYILYAEVPDTLFEILSTGEVHFSLNDGFSSMPASPDNGDHIFVISLDEEVCSTALASAEVANIFFEECPALPTPENYAPVYQASSTTSSRNGVVTAITYRYSVSPGRSDNMKDVYTSYVEKILQLGFAVNNDTGSSCEIYSSGTKLATVSVENSLLQFELAPGNESLTELSPNEVSQAMPTIEIGQTIITNDYEFTLRKVELSYEILPPNTNGVYTSYPAESGKVYVHVEADVKNTMPRDIRINELFSASVLYDGKYPYTGFTIVNDGDNDFDWVSSYVAATPLETCIAHSLVECPSEVDTSGKSIVVQLILGNTTYEYMLR